MISVELSVGFMSVICFFSFLERLVIVLKNLLVFYIFLQKLNGLVFIEFNFLKNYVMQQSIFKLMYFLYESFVFI